MTGGKFKIAIRSLTQLAVPRIRHSVSQPLEQLVSVAHWIGALVTEHCYRRGFESHCGHFTFLFIISVFWCKFHICSSEHDIIECHLTGIVRPKFISTFLKVDTNLLLPSLINGLIVSKRTEQGGNCGTSKL